MNAKIKALGWKAIVSAFILTILAWLGVFASAVANSTYLFLYLLVVTFVILAIYDWVRGKKVRTVENLVAGIASGLVPFFGISLAFAGNSMLALEFLVVEAIFIFLGGYIGSEVKV